MKTDFFNCVKQNSEFFLLPTIKLDWWDYFYIEVAFLAWRGSVEFGRDK
tara:strand:- start:1733 stop:1879 length:147 start_codon:yes stop_codon:yes gene_type:complete